MNGPYQYQRPRGDETCVWLGRKVGCRDHDYYLFADGDVWCLSSSDGMYAAEWWWRLTAAERDRRLTGGRTVAELVRNRGPVPGRPPAGPAELGRGNLSLFVREAAARASGLTNGLAVVRLLVEESGGSFAAGPPRADGGAEVVLTLPRYDLLDYLD